MCTLDVGVGGGSRTRVLSTEGMDHYAVLMADPEGNEFCLR